MRPSPVAALMAYWIGLIGLFAYAAMGSALSGAAIQLGIFAYILNVIFQWLAFAMPALIYYQRKPALLPSLRLFPLRPLSAVVIVVAAAIGVLPLNLLSFYWTMFLSSLGLTVGTGAEVILETQTELVWFLVYGVLAPAAFEEVLFRGFVLPAFETKGRRAAVCATALLFALLHRSMAALPAHILLGVILSLLALQTGSLYAPMLYHAVHNSVMALFTYLIDQADSIGPAESLPVSEEAIAVLPNAILLLALWGLLVTAALRMGAAAHGDSLPPADVAPWPKLAKILLVAAAALLLGLQVVEVLDMLPGPA